MAKTAEVEIKNRELSPTDVQHTLAMLFGNQAEERLVPFIWGPPGIGKSDVSRWLANEADRNAKMSKHEKEIKSHLAKVTKELSADAAEASLDGFLKKFDPEVHFVDIRMSQMEPTDLRGIPYLDPTDMAMKWANNGSLPRDPNWRGVILFDELNSAPPVCLAACYQIILDRKCGEYRLPEGAFIMAAGNRESDRGVTFTMPSPLANRFIHLEMGVNSEDWIEWAINHKVHPSVISYIKFNPANLSKFDPKTCSRGFATPRSWFFVSQILKKSKPSGMDQQKFDNLLNSLICGAIGQGQMVDFNSHRKYSEGLPDIEEILKGNIKEAKISQVGAQCTIGISLMYRLHDRHNQVLNKELTEKEWCDQVDKALGFLTKSIEKDLLFMTIKTAVEQLKMKLAPHAIPSLKEFLQKNGNLVLRAINSAPSVR